MDEEELEEIAQQIDRLSGNLGPTELKESRLELNLLQKRYFEISGESYEPTPPASIKDTKIKQISSISPKQSEATVSEKGEIPT